MALGVRIRTAAATILGGIAGNCVQIKDPLHKNKQTKDSGVEVDDGGPRYKELGKGRWPLSVRNFSVELLRFPVSGLFRVR